MIVVFLWFLVGLVGVPLTIYVETREGIDIRLDDLFGILVASVLGPFLIIYSLSQIRDYPIIFKKRKKHPVIFKGGK